MSENLSLSNTQSNFSFTRALVFGLGKPGSNWFKATVGDSLVMVFYPDDKSITAETIEPGDTLFVAGLKNMDVAGSCDKKASCAPMRLQVDAFKNSVRYRQHNKEAEVVEETTDPNAENESLNTENIDVQVDHSLRFNGLVQGKENVEYVKAKKEKYAARGRYRSMYAINEIVELARKNDT